MVCSATVTLVLIPMLAVVLHNPDGARAQTGCPASFALRLNNVESLRTLIRDEVASEVEAEVARRLPAAVEAEVQARLASTPGQL